MTKKPEIINTLSEEDKEIAMTMKAAAEAREETQQKPAPRRRRAAPATRQPRRARRRVSYDSSSDTTSDDDDDGEVIVEDDDLGNTDDDDRGAGPRKHGARNKHYHPCAAIALCTTVPLTAACRLPRRQAATHPTPVTYPATHTLQAPEPMHAASSAASTWYHAPLMMTPAGPSILLPAMSYDSFDPLALLRCTSGTSLSTVTLPGAGGSVGGPWSVPPMPQPTGSKGLMTNPWAAMSQSGWGVAERSAPDEHPPQPQLFSTVSLLQHAPSVALLPGASTLLPQGTSTLLHMDDLLPPGGESEVRPEGLWPASVESLGPRLADRVHDSANLSLGFLGTTPTPSGLQLLSDLLQGLGGEHAAHEAPPKGGGEV